MIVPLCLSKYLNSTGSRGGIFSCVQPLYERAVSDL
jgi:hypothetical protein